MSFIKDPTARVDIGDMGVTVHLSQPYEYDTRIETVFIPYLKVSQMRKLKNRETSMQDETAMLIELSGMSEHEFDRMHIQDFAVCLGVVQGFFLQFHETSRLYYAESTRLMLRHLSESLKDSASSI